MGLRQKAWARNVRDLLFAQLGRVCVDCGSQDKLQFDCIEPKGHGHHRCEYSQRMSFYRAQHAIGNLAVRCAKCNARKGARELEFYDSLPF
jgi:5-methylcytosine-specific restriction endonuclease McrA